MRLWDMISYNLWTVYLPHEMSLHYHDDIFDQLADYIITIRAKCDVSIMVLGNLNSRVHTCRSLGAGVAIAQHSFKYQKKSEMKTI